MRPKTAKLAGFECRIVKNNEKKWKIMKKVLAKSPKAHIIRTVLIVLFF
jgi:hypothetical protein